MIERFRKEKCERPARTFKALGHPARLWIAQQLVDGEHCVHELVEKIDLDFSTISQHLTALKAADVVSSEKRGKEIYYSLTCDCVRAFLACVAKHRRKG